MAAKLRKTLMRHVLKNVVAGGTAPKVVVPNGVVLLHQTPIADGVPMISNFAVKLETYLRMAQIPYENSFVAKLSSKGKIPWIEYNGQKIADSNFCIRFLNEEFKVDLDEKLDATERAMSHAILRMVEENTYWTMVYYRWIHNVGNTAKLFFPKLSPAVRDVLSQRIIQKTVKTTLNGQGLGRHTQCEIYSIARQDLQTLSDYLGAKPFVMGQEPSLVDTTVFGLMAQFLWQDTGSPMNAMLNSEFKNLKDFCERMREKYWLDWDDVISQRQKLQ